MLEHLDPESVVVHAGRPARAPDAPLSVPPVLASTFVAGGGLNYGREANPTWSAFEDAVAALEGGAAVAFSSGMAAISSVLDLVSPGGRVLASGRDGYSGTRVLLRRLHDKGRITWVEVEPSDASAVLEVLPGAEMLWVESPTNPLLQIADLDALTRAAHASGTRVIVDNTFATPLLQRPLELGADMVVHSGTKFLSGHSDVVLGVAAARDEEAAAALREGRRLGGGVPGPVETFLALRGLRTLGVRLERAGANAGILARRLSEHDAVRRVHYPGLEDHPGHELAARQMRAFGAVLAFEVDGEIAEAVCNRTRLIVHTTSLGGVETTMERRARHAGDAHLPPGLLRLSVGIEDVEDLWRDLEAALALTP